MRFVDVEQGTKEWHDLRRTHIGASSAAAIMGADPYRTALNVWEEMVLGKKSFSTAAMLRGLREEPRAREDYNQNFGANMIPKVVLNDDFPFLMASLDGIDEEKSSILEIKTPGEKTLDRIMKGEIPMHWKWQIQQQLALTDYEKCNLHIWNGASAMTLQILRDEFMIDDLRIRTDEFYTKNVLDFIPPSDEKEFVERLDSEWEAAANAWRETKESLQRLEKIESSQREFLLSLTGGKSTKGAGVNATRFFQKGTVQYDQIEQLKGVDLDKYRKPPVEKWRIAGL
jgi:putative phage-type endonuclease